MRKIIYITLFLSLLLDACSVSKKSGMTNTSSAVADADERTVESVVVKNMSAENFHIQKADISVTQDNFSARFTASIKFRRPDTILITVRSRSGIEAGRGLITKDTILINDRINNKLLVGSPSVIGPKYGIEPALFFVLFGDMIVTEADKKRSVNCLKGISRYEYEINGKRVEYIIDCKKRKVTQAYFAGDVKSGNITIGFSDIADNDQMQFPRRIEINDDLSSLNILLEIKKIERPWNGKIGFVPGHGYKVIVLK